MNREILSKLKQQAMEISFYSPESAVTQWKFNEDRFAELIIKECGTFMVDIILPCEIPSEHAFNLLLAHFGVKE